MRSGSDPDGLEARALRRFLDAQNSYETARKAVDEAGETEGRPRAEAELERSIEEFRAAARELALARQTRERP